jgi:hypothetical protein
LNADCGVALRIESGWATEDLRGDLILLERDAGMIEGVLGEVAKQFAERLRGVEAMTINKFLYLLEALLPADSESVRHSHDGSEVTVLRILLQQ